MDQRARDLLLDRRLVVAVVVLMANDWALKGWLGAGPFGVVTGKLSDLAAMVIGPVLLAALAGERLRGRPGLTLPLPGLLLVAINLSATAAAGYETALEWVTRTDHRVVVDPTDLVGLAGLVVGWAIVRRPRPLATGSGRLPALMFGLVAIGAATASSTPGSDLRTRVVVEDDRVYAVSEAGSAPRISRDDGVTWGLARGEAPAEPVTGQPTTELCLDTEPSVCVRLPDPSTIEESGDGGRTWRSVWRVSGSTNQWLTFDTHGYDGGGEQIALTDIAQTGDGAVLVAATVIDPIRRSPAGEWGPTVADLRRFQAWRLAPVAIALAFLTIGLAAIGAGPILVRVVGVGVAALGAGVALAHFQMLDVIGFVVAAAIPPGVIALGLFVFLLVRGPVPRRAVGRNLLIGTAALLVAGLGMVAWSQGLGTWEAVNRINAVLALGVAGLVLAIFVPADQARVSSAGGGR